jgi:hypothetical protein
MGVLLARSENQILVLETLLKRLIQVCVHTQDKRLAKELKLMDFTQLAKKIGDEHTHMRQMLVHEDGILRLSPAETLLCEPLNVNGSRPPLSLPPGASRLDDPQVSVPTLSTCLNISSSSQSTSTHYGVMSHQLVQHRPSASVVGQQPLPGQTPHSQQPLGPTQLPAMRRDGSLPMQQIRDPSMPLRSSWSPNGPLDAAGLHGGPGNSMLGTELMLMSIGTQFGPLPMSMVVSIGSMRPNERET